MASPRILGLDIGERRVGVAITDELGLSARPLLTLGRTNPRKDVKDVVRMVRRHGVAEIVAGNPLHLSGDLSPQAARAQAFAEELRQACGIPVHLQDERLSSAAANELLDRMGFPRGPERKAVLDQYAAVVILQDWLDARERSRAQQP